MIISILIRKLNSCNYKPKVYFQCYRCTLKWQQICDVVKHIWEINDKFNICTKKRKKKTLRTPWQLNHHWLVNRFSLFARLIYCMCVYIYIYDRTLVIMINLVTKYECIHILTEFRTGGGALCHSVFLKQKGKELTIILKWW